MTPSLVLIAAVLVAVAVTVHRVGGVVVRVLDRLATGVESIGNPNEQEFGHRLGALEAQVIGLPRQWEEFRNEAKRAEHRARAIVRDARKELESLGLESPALDAQAGEVRADDGDIRQSEGVHAVREDVAPSSPGSGVQDWASALRRKKYGT